MPNRWKGDAHDRYAALDNEGKRCDGNSRLCVRPAVQMIWVTRTDNSGPAQEIKQTCKHHRRAFEDSVYWKLLRTQRIPQRFSPEQLKQIPFWWRNPRIVGADDAARHAAEEGDRPDRTDDAA